MAVAYVSGESGLLVGLVITGTWIPLKSMGPDEIPHGEDVDKD